MKINRISIYVIIYVWIVVTQFVFAQPGYWVGVDLGTTNNSNGITHVQPADGTTTATSIGGLDCRRNMVAGSDKYMYFNVDDTYAFQGNQSNLYITIHYYDTSSGTFYLQYDSNTGSDIAARYKNGGSVVIEGSNSWKAWTFHVTDAYFGNRQNNGADFRIANTSGNIFYLDLVYVRIFCNGRDECVRMVPSTWHPTGHGAQARAMFENPEQWPQARAETDIFGIASMDIVYGGWADSEIQEWMGLIQDWGLIFSVEDGAVPGWTCDSQVAFNNLQNNIIDRIHSNGGRVDIVTNDHSLAKSIDAQCWGSGLSANYNNALSEVVDWYRLVRENYPDMQIFEWSPYPHLSISTIQNWVRDVNNGCAAIGVRGMDAFLLDADWRRFPRDGNWSQVKNMENYCRNRGIPFSLAYWCSPHTKNTNDYYWYQDVMQQASAYQSVGGSPDVFDHVSWETIPSSVPETQSYTLTNTLVDFVAQYVPSHVVHMDDADFVSSTIPGTMAAGQQYSVNVTMKNTGLNTWTRDDGYKLGAIDNSDPFASTRHVLAIGETVAPGEQKTFAFTMTAPQTPGTYLTDWQMVHENVRWFGDTHAKYVNVQELTVDPPTITQHPQSQLAARGTTVQFIVTATGQGTLSYQWFKDDNFLSDGDTISGAFTNTLQIADVQDADQGDYHCLVGNVGGSTSSNTATLTLPVPSDFDIDGDVDQEDFGHFQECMGAIVTVPDQGCNNADLNGDNVININDFSLFTSCMGGADQPPLCP